METKKGGRVLIVDDDINTCETLSDILEIKKFKTEIAHTGKDGLEMMTNQKFDIAMLDIRLPDIEGLDLLDRMKSISPSLIGVFITGHASVDYLKRALAQGASGFFVKPLIIEEILHVINEALEKQSLARLYKETSAKLKNIIGASHDAILATDAVGKILQFNRAAENIFGYSAKELEYMDIAQLLGRGSSSTKYNISERYDSSDKLREVKGSTKNGDALVLEITSGKYKEQSEVRYSHIIRDVSVRNKYEEEKAKLQDQLVQGGKMEAIGTLAGGIAHDFNNILTAILGFSQLVNNTLEVGSNAQKDMEQVLNAGQRAKELVRQILAFSRRSGEEVQPVHAHLIVKEALDLLRSSIPRSIDIILKVENKRALILINPTQFHQVIMNLCVNAYHAMAETGTLEVRAGTIPLSEEMKIRFPTFVAKEYLELVVKDTGKGMEYSTMSRIFEPYFTTKPMEDGTGLGLSTVHGIIHEAGGAIDVTSKLGKGSTFTVYLPIIEEEVKVQETILNDAVATGKERIFFIDDEMPIAELGKRILQKYGYDVSTNYCSTTALDVFKENPADFDLIITDNSMPKMTGTLLATKIFKIRSDIPIILITGSESSINKKHLGNTNVKKILIKPISIKDLSNSVREVLDG